MKVSDYFAELYVAGRFADAGWNVYFPHRDQGFDFVVSRSRRGGSMLLRPVQVKGKYPTKVKTDKVVYGYVGKLTEVHPEMVLAIPYFSRLEPEVPAFVAYMPHSQIRRHSRGYRCEPAGFKAGKPVIRRDFRKFFDAKGLDRVKRLDWKDSEIES